MNRRHFDIDHIDPRWEDGRDYQLVCGLDCPLNYREEDPTRNKRKNNRFLPWRWSLDEIGVFPVEEGDLAWFLVGSDIEKDVPGDWVLMEFLSEEWFQATAKTYGLAIANERWRKESPEEFRRVVDNMRSWCKNNRKESLQYLQKARSVFREKYNNMSDEELQERSRVISESTKKAMADLPPDKKKRQLEGARKGRERGAYKQHLQRWMCTVTGYITTPAPLSRYQKARGIDPVNRVRVE